MGSLSGLPEQIENVCPLLKSHDQQPNFMERFKMKYIFFQCDPTTSSIASVSVRTPVLTSTLLAGLCLEEMNFHYYNIQVQHTSYVPSKVCAMWLPVR